MHTELFRELFSHTTLSDVFSLCMSLMKHYLHKYICIYIYINFTQKIVFMHIYNWRKHCLHTHVYTEQEHVSCSQMCIILSMHVYT